MSNLCHTKGQSGLHGPGMWAAAGPGWLSSPHWALCSWQKPAKSGSAARTRALSTLTQSRHSTPCSAMSCSTPSLHGMGTRGIVDDRAFSGALAGRQYQLDTSRMTSAFRQQQDVQHLCSAAYRPPFPSGALATEEAVSRITSPLSVKHGRVPCTVHTRSHHIRHAPD